MLPAASSCRCGFQKCERARSISVMSARLWRPRLSPSFVASSRPPAPPPTMTTRWVKPPGSFLLCWRQIGAHTLERFGAHADRLRQRRMRVDRLADVHRIAAHLDRERDLADQVARVRAGDATP